MNGAALRLPDYLPYRLSVASNLASRLISRAYQQRFGLSIWEWRVIAVLGDGAARAAQDLCEATAMDKVTVSRAVRSLAGKGLVSRSRHARDGRSALVALTDQGRRTYAEIAPLALEYERALLAGFTGAEVAALKDLLARLERRADELAQQK
ncbi:MAG: winged helix-turn-helix transcriptional regulator [Maricaulaceae bacterium]|nr:winged helix-turn-helix transcriptional regulator [Maricaulaceae bacterium]